MTFTVEVPGPWAVDSVGNAWCIVNTETGRTKRIGLVTQPFSRARINYFDRACEEAARRNRIIQQNDAIPEMLAALEAANHLFTYALPQFNWGASALDARAIQLLNEVPRKVRDAIAKSKGARP